MKLELTTETWGIRDQRWIRSQHGTTQTVVPAMLDMNDAAWVEATHYPTGYLLSGIPLHRTGTENQWKPWVDFATDGLIEAFLLSGDQFVTEPGVAVPASTLIAVDIMTHGMVRLNYFPHTVTVLETDLPATITHSFGD